MALIGMSEAARRSGMTVNGVRRSLAGAGISLTRISERAIAVEEEDLARHLAARPDYQGPGRPRGAKNKVHAANKSQPVSKAGVAG